MDYEYYARGDHINCDEANSLRRDLTRQMSNIEELLRITNQNMRRIEARLDRMDNIITTLENKVNEMKSDVSGMKSDTTKMSNHVSFVESVYNTLKSPIEWFTRKELPSPQTEPFLSSIEPLEPLNSLEQNENVRITYIENTNEDRLSVF